MRFVIAIIVAVAAAGCSSRTTKAKEIPPKVETWSTVPIGSVYETKTLTRLEQPFVHETETTTRQTLIARDAIEASIKLEISEGTKTSAQDVKIPLRPQLGHDGSTATISDEKCTVAAGTFDCTKTTVEVAANKSTVTWTTNSIPVPIKTIVTNENMTTTTELTRVAFR